MQAATDRTRLASRIEQTAIKPRVGVAAWGQFVDGPRNVEQFGIYGTSASVQLLLESGFTKDSPIIRDALGGLRSYFSGPTIDNLYDDQDLDITFKIACALEASSAADMTQNVRNGEKRLRTMIIDHKGWGDHSGDSAPRMLATCHALLSLRNSGPFRTSTDLPLILTWLARQLLDNETLPIHEQAQAVLALGAYPNPATAAPDVVQQGIAAGLDRVLKWTAGRSRETASETASYHYSVTVAGREQNKYMFYLPDVLVARVLLLQHLDSGEAKRFVVNVVDRVCSDIDDNDGFRVPSTQRIATVDQLEVYRLLSDFISIADSDPQRLVAPSVSFFERTTSRRIVTTIVLLVLGLAGGYVAIVEDLAIVVRAAGALITAVVLGVLATALWDWVGGK